MTSLLRKFVAVRQRSKSPQKKSFGQPSIDNHAEHEFEHWTRGFGGGGNERRPPPPPQRLPPQIRTQYVDENEQLQALTSFQHPYSGNYWHSGSVPVHKLSNVSDWPPTLSGLNTLTTTVQTPTQNGAFLLPPSHANSSTDVNSTRRRESSNVEADQYANLNLNHHQHHHHHSTSNNNNNNTLTTLNTHTSRSRESVNDFYRSNSRLHLADSEVFPSMAQPRLRSESPQKPPHEPQNNRSRSKSPKKKPQPTAVKQTFDYLHSQCRLEGCSASILVEDARFLVCKHQLAHISEFFRTLFLNNRALQQTGVRQLSNNEYTIVVSALKSPPQFVQFQWFIECTVPGPILRDITDEVLETCMRLSKRFGARGLEVRCLRYVKEKVERKPPMTALCWLNWTLKHRFDKSTQESCMLVAARLSLNSLEKNRNMVTEKIYADMLAIKLRACYRQTASVFHTIHKMDHFHVEVEKCPRCSRQRDQGRIRLIANPCQKLIGCERCLKDLGCEMERKNQEDFQAFYQCEHGLLPFGDDTEDCQCQQKLYRRRLPASDLSAPPSEAFDFDGELAHVV